MSLKIVLASGNAGKVAEIQDYLTDISVELCSQRDLGVEEVAETGTTFVENAIIKARHAASVTGLPALADDSGLMVDALGGMPGVFSARYAGEGASDVDRINKLLAELGELGGGVDRSAAFYCALAYFACGDDPAPLLAVGCWRGSILTKPEGNNGFGYDPIFYVPSHHCSAAQLPSSIKQSISHRGLAMQSFLLELAAKLPTTTPIA